MNFSPTPSRILVTGCNGFLGTRICRQAAASGLSVIGTSRGVRSLDLDGLAFHRADVRLSEELNFIHGEGPDSVVHVAGLAHVFAPGRATAEAFREVNEVGTENVVGASVRAGVRHVVLISSVAVYGGSPGGSCSEEVSCLPRTPYAESKRNGELKAIELTRGTGTGLTILRMATLYGEGDRGNVARLIGVLDRGRFVWIGKGRNRKSLLHVEDAARACLLALTKIPESFNVYNVSAPAVTMREIVEEISRALGRPVPRGHIPAGPLLKLLALASKLRGAESRLGRLHGTLEKWVADDVYDASLFAHSFDFSSKVELADGIRRQVDSYRENSRRSAKGGRERSESTNRAKDAAV